MTGFVIAALCAGLCALNIYLGFVRPPRLYRHYPQRAAIVFLLLTIFSAYFGWREFRSVDELASLIEPVPEVVGVLYVPTAGEMRGIANAMAAIPGTTRTGNTQAERQQLADELQGFHSRYWRLDTKLSPDAVTSFYRDESPRRDWEIASDSPPFLLLRRGSETLMIYTGQDRLRGVTEVWYTHERGRE